MGNIFPNDSVLNGNGDALPNAMSDNGVTLKGSAIEAFQDVKVF